MQENLSQNYQPTCIIYPLERRKIIKKTLKFVWGWVFVLALFIGAAFVKAISSGISATEILYNRDVMWSISFGLLVLIGLLKLLYEIFYYKFYFYDLKDNQMIIRKGVIGRTEIATQYNRVQNVFVDQDFLDRIFGLYDVQIITAGLEVASTHPLNHIDGVNRQNAYTLRDTLLQKTQTATQKQGL